jgi:hypothetical protein
LDLIAMTSSLSITTDHDHDDKIDLLVLVEADCIYQVAIANKVGTKRLAQAAAFTFPANSSSSRCHVVCCVDRFKLWDDMFPPPLKDIFESIPMTLFDHVLVPPPPAIEQWKPSS